MAVDHKRHRSSVKSGTYQRQFMRTSSNKARQKLKRSTRRQQWRDTLAGMSNGRRHWERKARREWKRIMAAKKAKAKNENGNG